MERPNSPGPEVGLGSSGVSWSKITQKFLHVDLYSSDTQSQRFRQSSYRESEGPRKVCSCLYNLYCRWLKPEQHTKAEMMDLEQFLSILPPEIGSWFRECGAESCSQAVALAEGFLLSRAEDEKQEGQAQNNCIEAQPDVPASEESHSGPTQSLQLKEVKQEGEEGDGPAALEGTGMMLWLNPQSSLPFCDGVEVNQGPIAFEDVAVHFSPEEWALLSPDQKALHVQIMEEIHGMVDSLADDWKKSNVYTKCRKHFGLNGGLPRRQQTHTEDGGSARERHYKCNVYGEKPHQCQEFGRCFAQSSNLVSYKTLHTGEKQYQCQQCGKCFADSSALVYHKRLHTGEKRYQCQECGKCFTQSSSLVSHKRLHTGEKPHQCQECGKCFTQSFSLVSHKRVHTGEKPYQCQECGKCFARSSNLVKHKTLHTGEEPYKCNECGKSLASSSALVRHNRLHTGGTQYQCQECGKCFVYSSDLVRHKRLHTGEKPYQCQECGKRFAQSSALVIHKTMHTGEKPYQCQECGKGFAYGSALVKHKRLHTGEKPYQCQECGKCFTQSSSLVSHKRVHTGEKPYQCQECGKCFARRSNLVSHQKIHRREKLSKELGQK